MNKKLLLGLLASLIGGGGMAYYLKNKGESPLSEKKKGFDYTPSLFKTGVGAALGGARGALNHNGSGSIADILVKGLTGAGIGGASSALGDVAGNYMFDTDPKTRHLADVLMKQSVDLNSVGLGQVLTDRATRNISLGEKPRLGEAKVERHLDQPNKYLKQEKEESNDSGGVSIKNSKKLN